jgi:hypothetical protein
MVTLAEAQLMLIPAVFTALTALSICYLEHLRRRERDDRLEAQRRLFMLCRHVLALRVPEHQRDHLYKVMRYWTPEVLVATALENVHERPTG